MSALANLRAAKGPGTLVATSSNSTSATPAGNLNWPRGRQTGLKEWPFTLRWVKHGRQQPPPQFAGPQNEGRDWRVPRPPASIPSGLSWSRPTP